MRFTLLAAAIFQIATLALAVTLRGEDFQGSAGQCMNDCADAMQTWNNVRACKEPYLENKAICEECMERNASESQKKSWKSHYPEMNHC